jgi:DnaJ-domain-containing protein 1
MSFVVKTLGSWVGWRYIPDIISGQLLVYVHRLYPSVLGRQPPAPGTPDYIKHRRYLYALVVFSYAIYTFHQAATAIGPNFYELLGVSPTADEATLKAGFRAFARRYHPDRAGPDAEPLFMQVRDAYEALKKPTTRFAYDR